MTQPNAFDVSDQFGSGGTGLADDGASGPSDGSPALRPAPQHQGLDWGPLREHDRDAGVARGKPQRWPARRPPERLQRVDLGSGERRRGRRPAHRPDRRRRGRRALGPLRAARREAWGSREILGAHHAGPDCRPRRGERPRRAPDRRTPRRREVGRAASWQSRFFRLQRRIPARRSPSSWATGRRRTASSA